MRAREHDYDMELVAEKETGSNDQQYLFDTET
jgi:hypothetical protein